MIFDAPCALSCTIFALLTRRLTKLTSFCCRFEIFTSWAIFLFQICYENSKLNGLRYRTRLPRRPAPKPNGVWRKIDFCFISSVKGDIWASSLFHNFILLEYGIDSSIKDISELISEVTNPNRVPCHLKIRDQNILICLINP